MSDDLNNIVDVIEEFDYSTQNNIYNEKFRKWRKQKENSFAFSFEKNKKESIYIDGRGFIAYSAADAEKKALTGIFYNIGLAMLIWIAFDNVLNKIIISVLSLCGFDIHNNYFSSMIYGGNKEIVTILIITTLIKVLIPLLFLHFTFRLPVKVEFMGNMNNPMALVGTFSVALIVCTAASLPSAYSSDTKEIYELFKNSGADVMVWGQSEFIVYTVFEIIIMPIISEFFFRGAMFAVLRQFGDPFAIIMTSLLTGLMTQNLHTMPAVILISLVASYGMLSTGTVFTSIAVVIVYKMYDLALIIIESDPSDKMPLTRNFFMIVTLITGGTGLLIYWIYSVRKKRVNLALYKSELSFKKRFIHSVKTFPFSVTALLCLICALERAVM